MDEKSPRAPTSPDEGLATAVSEPPAGQDRGVIAERPAEVADGIADEVVAATAGPAGGAPEPAAGQSRRSFWRQLPFLIGVALVLSLLLKMFVVQPFYIPSESMEDTLRIGDRILVDKVGYRLGDIERGDIVVFNGVDSFVPEQEAAPASGGLAGALRSVAGWFGVAPPGERDFVKRVIGVGGDHVTCCDADGRITVNGTSLDESYLHPGDVPSAERFDVRVPEGDLWVMGDHRDVSQDSRAHLGEPGGGFVPADRVVGRAVLIMWPLGRAGTLPDPPQPSGTAAPTRSAVPGARVAPAAAAVEPAAAAVEPAALAVGPAAAGAPFLLGFTAALSAAALRRRARRRASRHRG